MFRPLVLIKHWLLNHVSETMLERNVQLVSVPWDIKQKFADGCYTINHYAIPLTTSLLTCTSGGWWNSALEFRSSPWCLLMETASAVCLDSGSLNVLRTLHSNSAGSELCFSSWCFTINPLLFFRCSFPRVNRFLSDSPTYLESGHFRHLASYRILFLWQIFPPPASLYVMGRGSGTI